MWHNVWLLMFPAIDWLITTVSLINTEEYRYDTSLAGHIQVGDSP